MSFLRGEDLTFHRFQTDDSRRPSEDSIIAGSNSNNNSNSNMNNSHQHNGTTLVITNLKENQNTFSPTVWTTTTSSTKSNYTTGTNEFQYISGGGIHDMSSSIKNMQLQNGSTAKLLPADDQTNKQVSLNKFLLVNKYTKAKIIK